MTKKLQAGTIGKQSGEAPKVMLEETEALAKFDKLVQEEVAAIIFSRLGRVGVPYRYIASIFAPVFWLAGDMITAGYYTNFGKQIPVEQPRRMVNLFYEITLFTRVCLMLFPLCFGLIVVLCQLKPKLSETSKPAERAYRVVLTVLFNVLLYAVWIVFYVNSGKLVGQEECERRPETDLAVGRDEEGCYMPDNTMPLIVHLVLTLIFGAITRLVFVKNYRPKKND